jgi:hypothetical protein
MTTNARRGGLLAGPMRGGMARERLARPGSRQSDAPPAADQVGRAASANSRIGPGVTAEVQGGRFHIGAGDCAVIADGKISVQWQLRVLKTWHSRQYDDGLIRRRPTVWAVDRNVGQSRGRLCQLICSQSAISGPYRGWLSVWQCCRQRATHLHKTINAGFAPAMFFDFAPRKFRAWRVLPPACTSSGPA